MSVVDLTDTVTIWFEKGNDGFGRVSYTSPVEAPAAIALKQERFTDINGDDSISQAVFYTETNITSKKCFVFFGSSTELSPPEGSEQVKATSQNPQMFGDLKKGWI